MDLARNYQICALLRVEALKIRNMLEVIGIDLSAVYDLIGLYVVLEDFDLQFIAFDDDAAPDPPQPARSAMPSTAAVITVTNLFFIFFLPLALFCAVFILNYSDPRPIRSA